MDDQSRFYFAYGSNLNGKYMYQKCPGAQKFAVARLRGYYVSFHGYSKIWDGAVETVIPDEKAEVWGVLYQMTAASWDDLDRWQDVRLDGMGAYFHYPIEVFTLADQRYEASMYKKAMVGQVEQPSQEYLTMIIQGIQEQGLPDSYRSLFESVKTKQAGYAVPRWPKQSYLAENCSGCTGD